MHSKIEATFYPVMDLNSWPTGIKNTEQKHLRQIWSFEIGIVWENVDEVLYHSVAEVILFLQKKERKRMNIIQWCQSCYPGDQTTYWLSVHFLRFSMFEWVLNMGVDEGGYKKKIRCRWSYSQAQHGSLTYTCNKKRVLYFSSCGQSFTLLSIRDSVL